MFSLSVNLLEYMYNKSSFFETSRSYVIYTIACRRSTTVPVEHETSLDQHHTLTFHLLSGVSSDFPCNQSTDLMSDWPYAAKVYFASLAADFQASARSLVIMPFTQ
jgi:hypothetical protein